MLEIKAKQVGAMMRELTDIIPSIINRMFTALFDSSHTPRTLMPKSTTAKLVRSPKADEVIIKGGK